MALPPFISSFFAPPKIVDVDGDMDVLNDPLSFTIPIPPGYQADWDFGDPASGTANTAVQQHGQSDPTHSYAANGVYLVTVTVRPASSACGAVEVYTKKVAIGPKLIVSDGLTICPGDTAVVSAYAKEGYPISWASDRDVAFNALSDLTQETYEVMPGETTTYTVTTRARKDGAPNLIPDGNFESGESGFSTGDYKPYASVSGQGRYGVVDNAKLVNLLYSGCSLDRTPGAGTKMLVVAGANGGTGVNNNGVAPGSVFWHKTVTGLTPGTEYGFTAWFASMVSGSSKKATVQLYIDGVAEGVPFEVSGAAPCQWFIHTVQWAASSGSHTFTLAEVGGLAGNDFAVDDISLYEIEDISEEVVVTVNEVAAPVPSVGFTDKHALCPPGPHRLSDLKVDHDLAVPGQTGLKLKWYASNAATDTVALHTGAYRSDGIYYAAQVVKLDGVECEGPRLAVEYRLNKVVPGSIEISGGHGAEHKICASDAGLPPQLQGKPGDDAVFLSGATGTYQWWKDDGSGPQKITGETGKDLSFTPLTKPAATTDYWREAVSDLYGEICTEKSNAVRIVVLTVPASTGLPAVLHACEDHPEVKTTSIYDLAWLQSKIPSLKWYDQDGSGGTEYTNPTDKLDVAKEYWASQSAVVDGKECWSVNRTEVTFLRDIKVDAGKIDITGTGGAVCWPIEAGGTLGTLTSTDPAEGVVGSGIPFIPTYSWYIEDTGGKKVTFGGGNAEKATPILNVNSDYLHPYSGSLSLSWPGKENRFYRRATVTKHGETCWRDTDPAYIRINKVDGGTIVGNRTVCKGTDPEGFGDSALGSFLDGSSTFVWEKSTNPSLGWTQGSGVQTYLGDAYKALDTDHTAGQTM